MVNITLWGERMPINTVYADDRRGVLLEYSGAIESSELVQAFRDIVHDKSFNQLLYFICNRTGSDQIDISSEYIHQLANISRIHSRKNPELLFALVCHNKLEFGMARMYQIMTDGDGFTAEIYRSLDEAHSWINNELSLSLCTQ